MSLSQIQQKHLDSLIKCGAFQFSEKYFVYDSGEISPYIFDTSAILHEGRLAGKICRDIIQDIKQKKLEFDIIAGGESIGGKSMGGRFSFTIATILEKPHTIIYDKETVDGANVENQKVLIIGDFLYTGYNTKKIWLPAIQKERGNLIGTYFYMDKQEGGQKTIESLGLQHNFFLELNDQAWNHILAEDNFTKEVYQTMQQYRENPQDWIKEKLTRILTHTNRSSEENKILRTYSDIKKEIMNETYKEI